MRRVIWNDGVKERLLIKGERNGSNFCSRFRMVTDIFLDDACAVY